ncbi:MAG: HAD family hydrolase [Planctomycetaceae bacterium]|nr:HAD family hydrolase [Planctomycetaceae bacterium]
MKIRAVIFDLDGTLTKPFLDFDLIRTQMGLSPLDGGILEAMEAMEPQARQKAQFILAQHETAAAANACLHEGVHELFGHLRGRNISIGLLTRNTRQNALAVAAMHALEFDAIVDRTDGPVKPDGFGVRRLCRIFGAAPRDTLVVGDFLHDLRSARHAGAWAVLIRTHPQAHQFENEADYSIDCLHELMPLIGKLEQPT